jgi:hypothetical protein
MNMATTSASNGSDSNRDIAETKGADVVERRDFLAFLNQVPNVVKALDIATSAILAVLVSRLYVPAQLRYLPESAFGIAAFAVLAGWFWYQPLRKELGRVIVVAVLLLVALIILNQQFVLAVPPNNADSTPYLVGTELSEIGKQASAELGTPSNAILIDESGPDAIPILWKNYSKVELAYTLVFCCFVFVGSLAISSSISLIPRE